ncbi:DUF4236 domain-containing protein [Caballeronia sp. LZ001]|uniref:DUF4236 domain-containing protein n=1 Tax=Caballeronia sp. LZ001 TaxID=3038553 RepID=UPI0028641BB5|nr:DUF4236 domain-containing protein [Caballeronia sp. LZ001]MDR5801588.1 DUF4236 domain-containing protein [Caballeronia sp. LZ001]
MGLSFRKSVKIAPGIKLNFSKSGMSASLGGRGLTYTTRGRVTASIPGTGIKYTSTSSSSRPVRSPRLPSQLIESASMPSKRDQANAEFLMMLGGRLLKATQDYFFSWGVCVSRDDFEAAAELPEHAPTFEAISKEMDIISTACRLLSDIGSISLIEKEKAMRALYAVEEHFQSVAGSVDGLRSAVLHLKNQISAIPPRPNSEKYIGITFALVVLSIWWLPFLAVAASAALFGGLQWWSYVRARRVSNAALEAADNEIDQLVQLELTPRDKTALQ